MRIGETPFALAEIVDPAMTAAVIRYGTGMNCSGTHQHEVLQNIAHPDGTENTFVIMRGVSRAKAEAITMILNAPEPG
jgi:hypothetical protein